MRVDLVRPFPLPTPGLCRHRNERQETARAENPAKRETINYSRGPQAKGYTQPSPLSPTSRTPSTDETLLPLKPTQTLTITRGVNRNPQRPHNGQLLRRRTILRLHRLPRRLAHRPLDHRTSPTLPPLPIYPLSSTPSPSTIHPPPHINPQPRSIPLVPPLTKNSPATAFPRPPPEPLPRVRQLLQDGIHRPAGRPARSSSRP